MSEHRFSQVDVFSTEPFGGNPVAVVHDAADVPTERMQAFARWTNLSETTFLLPPTDGQADYRLRIFTPSRELPFAGHPTLGSCAAWLAAGGRPSTSGTVVQECGVGQIPIRLEDGGTGGFLAFAAPPLIRTGPAEPELRARLIDILGVDAEHVVDTQWVDNGVGWVAVLLDSAQTVLDVHPAHSELDIGLVAPAPAGAPYDFEVRAFFEVDGSSVEDPVTGSLNAGLAIWLTRSGRAHPPYLVHQGTALGRTGRVRVDTDPDGTLWVGGAAQAYVGGTVTL